MTYRIDHRPILTKLALATALLSTACDSAADARSADGAVMGAPTPGVVDSVFPPEEAMRRFRESLPAVSTLQHAEPTRDSLVRRFVRSIETRDTTALRAIVMTRAEFAYLYYPASPHARPPAQQPPALVWFLHAQNSEKGVGRALDRFGGRGMRVRGYTCAQPPRLEAENRIWDDCRLHVGRGADTATLRLFGGIIERDGRFKLLSYSNDL